MIEGLLHIFWDKIEQVDVKDLFDGRVVFLSRKTIDNESTRIEASFVEEGACISPIYLDDVLIVLLVLDNQVCNRSLELVLFFVALRI